MALSLTEAKAHNETLAPSSIRYLVVHCSDTPSEEEWDASSIHAMHLSFGWHGCGYHAVITRGGEVQKGRPEYWVGAHVKGHNKESLGVCLVGLDSFTDAQLEKLEELLKEWKAKYPKARICGHCDFDSTEKTCPNFDVGAWATTRGLQ